MIVDSRNDNRLSGRLRPILETLIPILFLRSSENQTNIFLNHNSPLFAIDLPRRHHNDWDPILDDHVPEIRYRCTQWTLIITIIPNPSIIRDLPCVQT